MSNIFSNSVGRKLLMSLAGIFLLSFLLVHLGINLLVLLDNHELFNKAAHFMGTNPVIKVFEVVLFGGILIHIVYASILTLQNMKARPVRYAKSNHSQTSFFSKYMVHTAIIIGIFLVVHLMNFYVKAKFIEGGVGDVMYDGKHYHDLASLVIAGFSNIGVVIFYVVCMVLLGFHLHHGFQSAFQTLGINHKVYTPVVKALGVGYSILVSVGFIIIPIVVYITK